MTTSSAAPKPSEVCPKHNLPYDAVAGCLMCRSDEVKARRRTARAQQVAWAAGIGALGLLAAAVVLVVLGRPDHRVGGEGATLRDRAAIRCVRECAAIAEECTLQCAQNANDERCYPSCVNGSYDCSRECGRSHRAQLDPYDYLYAGGALPNWDSVARAIEHQRFDLAECSEESAPLLLARFSGGPPRDDTGTAAVPALVVASREADASLEECATEVLSSVALPASIEPYHFVVKLDPSHSLAERALSQAELALAMARREDDKDRVADAQRRVWDAREALRIAQKEDARERARRAELRRAKEQRESAATWHDQMVEYTKTRQLDTTAPTREERYIASPQDGERDGYHASYGTRAHSQLDTEDRWAEEKKQREIRRLEREARWEEYQNERERERYGDEVRNYYFY